MGTRAQFFIGNPQDIESREYLGCVAWDGYPQGDCGDAVRGIKTVDEFRAAVASLARDRDDFSDAKDRAWPFPWTDDLFLTDVTFAFFNDQVYATEFHHGFRPLEDFSYEGGAYPENHEDELPRDVPAPTSDKPPGKDSIMIMKVG